MVEASPELLAHVESLRAVAQTLGQPVTPSPAKQSHVAAALDLFDDLYGTADTTASSRAAATSPAGPTPTPTAVGQDEATGGNVVSLGQERERRRRVSVGVIAAAIAAVALLLFAVLSSGGVDTDVATSSTDAAVAESNVASTGADDAGDADAAEEAMDDEEEAEAPVRAGGLSEAPAAAAAPVEAAEEAMADEEEAMDDEEAADRSASDAATESAAAPLELFSFGDISEQALLERQLSNQALPDLQRLAAADLTRLFPQCRAALDELPNDGLSLLGEGVVHDMMVEVHLVESPRDRRIYVVAANECRVIFDFALAG